MWGEYPYTTEYPTEYPLSLSPRQTEERYQNDSGGESEEEQRQYLESIRKRLYLNGELPKIHYPSEYTPKRETPKFIKYQLRKEKQKQRQREGEERKRLEILNTPPKQPKKRSLREYLTLYTEKRRRRAGLDTEKEKGLKAEISKISRKISRKAIVYRESLVLLYVL